MITFHQIAKADVPLLTKWFNLPHVQRFYSLRSWEEEEVLEKIKPCLLGDKPLFGFIIQHQHIPIGYLQYYALANFPWPEQDFDQKIVASAAGLDLFIGEVSWIGKGLGKEIVNQFLNEVIWQNFSYCVVDPDVENLASRKMFAKCGFHFHKVIASKDPLGKETRLCLMIKTRP